MKRLISFLLVLVLLSSVSFAFADDYSSMTESELKKEFDAIRNELTVRGFKAENKTIIFDKDDIQIYITDDYYIGEPNIIGEVKFYIPVVIVNNTQQNINIYVYNSSLNGWTLDAYFDNYSIPARKKSKTALYFYIQEFDDIETVNDFTDAEFSLRIEDATTYKDIIRGTEPITIYTK